MAQNAIHQLAFPDGCRVKWIRRERHFATIEIFNVQLSANISPECKCILVETRTEDDIEVEHREKKERLQWEEWWVDQESKVIKACNGQCELGS